MQKYQRNYTEALNSKVPVYTIPPESEIWSEVYAARERRKARLEVWAFGISLAIAIFFVGGLLLALLMGK